VDATHRVTQPNGHSRQVKVSPESLAPVMDAARLRPAVSAPRDLPGRRDLDQETVRHELEAANDKLLDGENDSK